MTHPEPNNPPLNVQALIALLALSLSFLCISQIVGIRTTTEREMEAVKSQSGIADKQIAALKESSSKLAKTIEEHKERVAQSEATQKQFTDVMKDLDALAREGDEDAKSIMARFDIVHRRRASADRPDKK